MQNLRRLCLPALLGASVLLSGCGGSPTERRSISASAVAGGAGFAPTELTVNKDENVVLNVGNSTAAVHGFSIEGYGIREEVPPGPGTEVTFKSRKPGTFKIFCQLHEAHRIATLVVR